VPLVPLLPDEPDEPELLPLEPDDDPLVPDEPDDDPPVVPVAQATSTSTLNEATPSAALTVTQPCQPLPSPRGSEVSGGVRPRD
jgi:hypothetical protein